MINRPIGTAMIAALWCLCVAAPATADVFTNVITNGDFEQGFNGWNVDLACPMCQVAASVSSLAGDGGTNSAFIGSTGKPSGIWQLTETTPGANYLLSFDFASTKTSTNQFFVTIGTTQYTFADVNAPAWTPESIAFVADSDSTLIAFSARDNQAIHAVDNVVLVDPPALTVPEPAMLGLFGLGLVGLGFSRRTQVS